MAPTEAQKNDAIDNKLRVDLIPLRPLIDVAQVLTFGARKYGDRNWENGLKWSRCFAAAIRHLWAWALGETFDKESGVNHLAHVVVNCLFLLEFRHTHANLDDRPTSIITQFRLWNMAYPKEPEQKHE